MCGGVVRVVYRNVNLHVLSQRDSLDSVKGKVEPMSQVITAVYEHGVLHPLTPLGLHEHQRVHVQIVPEEPQETVEHVLEWLTRIGRVSSPRHAGDTAPCSDTERAQLAQALGKTASTPLSTTIIEERGEW